MQKQITKQRDQTRAMLQFRDLKPFDHSVKYFKCHRKTIVIIKVLR